MSRSSSVRTLVVFGVVAFAMVGLALWVLGGSGGPASPGAFEGRGGEGRKARDVAPRHQGSKPLPPSQGRTGGVAPRPADPAAPAPGPAPAGSGVPGPRPTTKTGPVTGRR